MNIRTIGKNLGVRHNVSFRVIDEATGKVVSTHIGHNSATNSLLTGIGHYLKGDGVLNQGWEMLSHYVPKYISLGTMGLMNQDEDSIGLPAGIGVVDYTGRVYGQLSDDRLAALGKCIDEEYAEAKYGRNLEVVDANNTISEDDAISLRYIDYMNQSPGFGADGYSSTLNNNRTYLGLGPIFADRGEYLSTGESSMIRGDIDGDGHVTTNDLKLLLDYISGKAKLTDKQMKAANITYRTKHDEKVDMDDAQMLIDFLDHALDNSRNLTQNQIDDLAIQEFGSIVWDNRYAPTINCELISDTFPRAPIGYRDIIPEVESEFPKTIDVVFSAMISTGALAQFREPGRDYIFITEAGLWSEQTYTDGGDNGLLAGYRIAPPNKEHWDMADHQNRDRLAREVLKVGKNQVVQIIWKIQLGSIDQFEGIESLYPSTETLKWIEHGKLSCGITDCAFNGDGWIFDDGTAPDLEPTYDAKASEGTYLTLSPELHNSSPASLVYTLDDAYDLTGIKIRLSAARGKSGASAATLRLAASADGKTFHDCNKSFTLIDKGTDIYNVGETRSGSKTIDYINQLELLGSISKDVRYVKLMFYPLSNVETRIQIAHVEVYALDAIEVPEGTTSLKWNVW